MAMQPADWLMLVTGKIPTQGIVSGITKQKPHSIVHVANEDEE